MDRYILKTETVQERKTRTRLGNSKSGLANLPNRLQWNPILCLVKLQIAV